jgi:hypothetical protein
MDFNTSTSDMREAQQMNRRMILERLAGFFGGIAPFPDGGQQQQIETISAMLHSFAMGELGLSAVWMLRADMFSIFSHSSRPKGRGARV